jgi:methyl-accepting chemotaxis protein
LFTIAAEKIEETVDILVTEMNILIEDLKIRSTNEIENIRILTVVVIATIVLIGILFIFYLARNISNPIKQLDKNITVLSTGDLTSKMIFKKDPSFELKNLNDNLNGMIDEFALIIGTITNSSKLLTTSAQNVASSAEEVDASSEEISVIAQQITKGTQIQSDKLNKALMETKDLKNLFDEEFKHISNTANMIKSLSSQVNILALNASIEAARAGEYGRGFAVVAENIRLLSENTKASVNEVDTLTMRIKNLLVARIEKIVESINSISVISEQTVAGAEESSTATEEQAATMEEMSAAAQELTNLSLNLESLVKNFKIM